MAPSRYDWKIVDWDVKPQHNQPNPRYPFTEIIQLFKGETHTGSKMY